MPSDGRVAANNLRQSLAAPRSFGAGLAVRLAHARLRTDELFRLLHPEALYDRPIPERHRLIFYLGHLEAFDWNMIARAAFEVTPFREDLDHLLAFGIDPVDGNLPTDQPSDWPPERDILDYNRRVRSTIDSFLEKASFSNGGGPLLENGFIFHVGIEHRLMHAETLAYLLHQLPLERLRPPRILPALPMAGPDSLATPRCVEIPAGSATLGLVRNGERVFGWDNEFEPHTVGVPAFAIDAYPVTNGQYLEFVRQGGYQERSLWSEKDWAWIGAEGIEHPRFWRKQGEGWRLRAMFAEIPLPPDWPVYISHAEASAYARWRGLALPSEAQRHRAAYGSPDGNEREYPWGSEPPKERFGNFDFNRWDPTAVDAHPEGRSAFGVYDLVGNGWEWTSTVIEPFPGFKPFPFYPGYSADFFDGQHYVVKGGSSRTGACLLRRSFRNWYQPHYPYAYATFRCVEN